MLPLNNEKRRQAKQLFEASALGWMFPIAIGMGYVIGHFLDKWLGTSPWLTWIFLGFGVIAAFLNLFRLALRDDGGNTPKS
jgi:ATP synthase protein I